MRRSFAYRSFKIGINMNRKTADPSIKKRILANRVQRLMQFSSTAFRLTSTFSISVYIFSMSVRNLMKFPPFAMTIYILTMVWIIVPAPSDTFKISKLFGDSEYTLLTVIIIAIMTKLHKPFPWASFFQVGSHGLNPDKCAVLLNTFINAFEKNVRMQDYNIENIFMLVNSLDKLSLGRTIVNCSIVTGRLNRLESYG